MEANDKQDNIKIAMLLPSIGSEALDGYNQFTYGHAEDKTNYDVVFQKFEDHFKGMKCTVFCRYNFWTHRRTQNQPVIDYLTALQQKADTCEFAEKDNMIRDKVIFSIANHERCG